MKKYVRRILSVFLAVLIGVVFPASAASADNRAAESKKSGGGLTDHLMRILNGGSIEDDEMLSLNGSVFTLPEGITSVDRAHDSREYANNLGFAIRFYDYEDAAQSMAIRLIKMNEKYYSNPPMASNKLMNTLYQDWSRILPLAKAEDKGDGWFVFSGYRHVFSDQTPDEFLHELVKAAKHTLNDEPFHLMDLSWSELEEHEGNAIYYFLCAKEDDTIYTLMFLYPEENCEVCDKLIQQICADFTADRDIPFLPSFEENETVVQSPVISGSSNGGSSGSTGTQKASSGGTTCPKCGGSGRCKHCSGLGRSQSFDDPFVWEDCPFCVFGDCPICDGKGVV